MFALLLYALKTGACLTLFYLFFKLLLSRETFHRLNRAAVLAMLALSCLLPLCVVTFTRELPAVETSLAFVTTDAPGEAAALVVAEPFPWREAAALLYLAGVFVALARMVRSLVGVWRMIRSGRRERLDDGTVLVRTTLPVAPFSWGRWIVLNETDLRENGETILCHERAHARLRHSADLLFCDLVCCMQWFNPALWLLRADLRAIHEYEADEAVLASGADARAYQLLLIKKAVGERWYSVANSFNHSKLKNRITMMIRKRSPRWAAAKALLLLLPVGAALGAFAETRYVASATESLPAAAVPAVVRSEALPAAGASHKDSEKIAAAQEKAPRRRRGAESRTETRTATRTVTTVTNDGKVVVVRSGTQPGQNVSTSVSSSNGVTMTETSDGKITIVGYGTMPKESRSTSVSSSNGVTTVTTRGTVVQVRGGAADTVRRESTSIIVGGGEGPVQVIRSDGRSAAAGEPLFLVDGKAVSAEVFRALDPVRIATVTVLKESEAVARYGEAARNGAVVILTKKKTAPERSRRIPDLLSISGDRVVVRTENADESDENRVITTYTGRLTLQRMPDASLILINGREAARDEVKAIRPRRIRKIVCYNGTEAVARYGEKGRGGVCEIFTRR